MFQIKKLIILFSGLLLSLLTQAEQFNVLLFTGTQGFHHQSQLEGVAAMRTMAQKHFFTLDWQEDPKVFNDANLEKFQAIVFLSTTGDIFDAEQKSAIEKFIRSGKGFVGIHSASDTEYNWEWFTKLVGRSFHIHPVNQTAELQVISRKFPGLERMPDRFLWTDEYYEFGPEHTKGLNYILAVDEKSYDPNANWGVKSGKGMGKFHPLAWYHEYDGGRSFYTALGHIPATYSDPLFLEHVYGGIYWAATGKGLKK